MKRNIYQILTLVLITITGLTSCQSERDDQALLPETKKYPVTFSISEFGEEIKDAKQTLKWSVADKSEIKKIIYIAAAYSMDTRLISTKVLVGSDLDEFKKSNKLTIQDTLFQGDYRVSIAAFGDEDVNVNFSFGLLKTTYGYLKEDKVGDIFFNSFALHIGEQAINRDITLSRLNGAVSILIEDANLIPEDVVSLYAEMPVFPYAFKFTDGTSVFVNDSIRTGSSTIVSDIYTREDILKMAPQQTPIEFRLLETPPNNMSSLNITLVKKDGTKEYKLIKRSPKIERNKVVRLSGTLFTQKTNTDLIFDTQWKEVIEDSFDKK